MILDRFILSRQRDVVDIITHTLGEDVLRSKYSRVSHYSFPSKTSSPVLLFNLEYFVEYPTGTYSSRTNPASPSVRISPSINSRPLRLYIMTKGRANRITALKALEQKGFHTMMVISTTARVVPRDRQYQHKLKFPETLLLLRGTNPRSYIPSLETVEFVQG